MSTGVAQGAESTSAGGNTSTDTETVNTVATINTLTTTSTTGEPQTSAGESSTETSTTSPAPLGGTLTSTTVSTADTSSVTTSSSTTETTTGDGTTGGGSDLCPDDPNKTVPGSCGCGTPDTDSDGDSTPDCDDDCPDDPDRVEPGGCGCGEEEDAACAAIVAALLHRYSFSGSGTQAADSVGSANGTVVGATLSGGSVALSEGTYVDLPNGTVSSLTSATFEVWLTWSGGDAWQRIFDFGSSDAGENAAGTGETYLFLSPRAVDDSGSLRVAYTTNGPTNETYVDASAALPTGTPVHVAVTVGGGSLALYLNGAAAGSATLSGSLGSIDDVNNWIGISQFEADPGLEGSISEFRIYKAALTAAQVAKSYALGADAPLGQ